MSAAVPEYEAIAAIERAMIALQRIQSRRAPRHRTTKGTFARTAMVQVLDAVEVATAANQPITVTGVGEALSVDQPRASRLVADAVSAGLIRRGADPCDGRRSVLTLTEDGARTLAASRHHRRAELASALADWPAEDRQTLGRLLSAFVSRWEEAISRD